MGVIILAVTPMYVCLFWSLALAFDLISSRTRWGVSPVTTGWRCPRIHLLIFMSVASVLYFGHLVFFCHKVPLIPFTDTLYVASNLAVYPLYYLYICSLTTTSHHARRLLLLFPCTVGGVFVALLYSTMSHQDTELFINTYLYGGSHTGLTGTALFQAYIHDVCKALFALMTIIVLYKGSKHIMHYEQLLKNAYADIEGKSLYSLHNILRAFVATTVLSFIANAMGRHLFTGSYWTLALPSTVFSVMLFLIGYIGYHTQFCIYDIAQDEQQADTLVSDSNTILDLSQRIDATMREESLFLRRNLKVVDLARLLGTNRNYIYLAINGEMGQSFSEYVNRMRVDYARQLMTTHPGMNMTDIAEQSGFSSATSFYRNFKLYTGLSPKEYSITKKTPVA